MGVFVCAKCSETVEARCKPGKCPKCGAVKDDLIKQDVKK